MTARLTLPAFTAYGIELEYMIVDCATLDVRPIADRLLAGFAGKATSSVDRGALGWSNELVAHLAEVKNIAPTPGPLLEALAQRYQDEVVAANRMLEPSACRLLPTGMHPWMDPARETTLWSAEGQSIYRMYDRIFDCRRHGWANLQSMHLNLPFADDREFERLHAAVRLMLPLVPALAASSPVVDGREAPARDYRLEVYRTNSDAVPAVTGDVIPDTVRTRDDYEKQVFAPLYQAIAPHDPEGVLQHEWLNSRAAIPRFDRNAIEIRLADTQECPRADVAIAAATIGAIQCLYEQRWTGHRAQQAIPTATLSALLLRTVRDAEEALIDDPAVLTALGVRASRCTAGELWSHLIEAACDGQRPWWCGVTEVILSNGTLATRILRSIGGDFRRARLAEVYRELALCLAEARMLM